MVAPLVIAGAAIAAVPHIIGGVYVASIAFDPLQEKSRAELLQHVVQALIKLRKLDRLPSENKLKSLRADIKLLRKSVPDGWTEWSQYLAALRLSAFMSRQHFIGTMNGVGAFVYNTASSATDATSKKVNEWLDWVSTPSAGDPEGNIRGVIG